jgi:hypothetical protein
MHTKAAGKFAAISSTASAIWRTSTRPCQALRYQAVPSKQSHGLRTQFHVNYLQGEL